MNILSDNLFGMRYQSSIIDSLLSSFIILLLAILLFYVIYLITLKISKSGLHRDFHVRTSFLWALFVQQLLFSVYLFFLLRSRAFPPIQIDKPLTYLCLFPHVLLYFGTIGFFVHSYFKLKEESQSA